MGLKLGWSSTSSFLSRHWRGELAPWVGLFVIPVAMVVVFRVLDYGLGTVGETLPARLPFAAWVALVNITIYYACQLLCMAWWLTGAWRSAIRMLREKATRFEIVLAVTITFTILVSGYWFEVVLPQFKDVTDAIQGDPQWGEATVEATADGRTITFRGPITARSAQAFDTNDALVRGSVRLVVLESDGGRAAAARQIQRSVRAHKLDVLVTGKCASACTIAFLGGKRRLIRNGAKIGFHSASVGNSEEYITGLDEDVSMGVSREFLVRAYSVEPANMWYPTSQELLAAGVITAVVSAPPKE